MNMFQNILPLERISKDTSSARKLKLNLKSDSDAEKFSSMKKIFFTTVNNTGVCTFYGRNLRIFPIKLECSFMASLSSLVYCLRVRPGAYNRVEPLQVLHLGKLQPQSQILDQARNTCQGQPLQLITEIHKLRPLKVLQYRLLQQSKLFPLLPKSDICDAAFPGLKVV